MRFTAILPVFLGLAAWVSADNITVKVAENGGLTFSPDSVTAKTNDIINFQFLAGNHSVTQSSFNDPCTKLTTNGVDSGYQPATANSSTIPQWSFTVTNGSQPLWFYCKQGAGGHCKAGMVFAVNPTTNETYDAFKARATGNNTNSTSSTGSSSSTPSSTGSSVKPSASSNGAALGSNPSQFAGIVALVAVLAGSIL